MDLLASFGVEDRPARCEPVFRWTGSKRDLFDTINRRLPSRITGNYLEPFVGGGAIALGLLSEPGRIAGSALLSDVNAEIVITYATIRDQPEPLITALSQLREHHASQECYERIRDETPPPLNCTNDIRVTELGEVWRAARFLYLIAEGWHGLWRENSDGKMNIPWGGGDSHYPTPERIRLASTALSRARVFQRSFEETIEQASDGDVVFADPPYLPRTKTASFTAYSAKRFDEAAHVRLDAACQDAAQRGALILVTNSDTPTTRRIFHGTSEVIMHGYKIGADRVGKDPVHELLIRYGRSAG